MRAWWLPLALIPRLLLAATAQMPEGGRPVAPLKGRVLCGPLPDGWRLEADEHFVRPPPLGSKAERAIDVAVASDLEACAHATEKLTLVAMGPWPELDPAGVFFFPDEARMELRGRHLAGVQIIWEANGKTSQEQCLDPAAVGDIEHCVVPLERNLVAETGFRWLPAGARQGPDVTTYGGNGQPVDPSGFVLKPSRIVISQLLAPAAAVDMSQGSGKIPLLHPRAVAGADCGLARCEIADGAVLVRGVPAPATNLSVQLRLAPRVYIQRGDKQETTVTATLPLVHCPLTLVTGAPLRNADDAKVGLRIDQRCLGGAQVRWTVGAEPAEVVKAVRVGDADLVLLRVGRLVGDKVTITAARDDTVGGIIGSITSKTEPAPRPHATVELPGRGRIDFIPTNRDAVLTVTGAAERSKLVPLSVEGVYGVRAEQGKYLVRGTQNLGGLVSLRFGYRVEGIPAELAGTNLAVLTETIQRPVREASVPASLTKGAEPIAEFICADKKGEPQSLPPGKPTRISFDSRDTCRVVIHQERLKPEDGMQEVVLDVDVTRAEGGKRPEASLSERMVLRPGGETRLFFLKGAAEQFDRIVVRLSHVVDETRYVLSPVARQAPPSAQWSVTVEGGWARLYVTVAVPAGLYRMNEPAGQLTLNFGVLGRLTSLDKNGKEGLLGLETGLMGVGLIPQRAAAGTDPFPRTLAAVMGVGVRVNLGGGAAVGVHLWGAYEFRDSYEYAPDPKVKDVTKFATRWSLIFGPSISIGNVGTNL